MAITNTEILTGISAAFEDAASWARAMKRLAITDDIAELQGVIAQGEAKTAARDQAEAVWLEQRHEELRLLEDQLRALAEVPVVPVESTP